MSTTKPFAQDIDGVPRDPHCDPEVLKGALKFRAREGDLVLLSFPKSGTHWVLYIVQLILKKGQPITSYDGFTQNIIYLGVTHPDDLKPSLPLRLISSHYPLRKEFISSEAKYIYVTRNPWDVCVSFYHMVTSLSAYRFQDGTFDQFFDAFMSEDVAGYGNYFDHVVSGYELKDIPNVFFVTYENLTKDTRGTVLKLARFLGDSYAVDLEKDNRMLNEMLERCSADHMREAMVADLRTNSNPGIDKVLRRLDENCKDGHSGDSKKYCFVREAKVGGWKRYFSREQLRRLEEAIKKVEEISPVMELWNDIREEATAASTDK
ncbi:sulfotransferase 2A8-like [Dermacentor albipictus]|uniref:sulfotransferase 2A8-like n=1 Tax=Dermacentor albipictus TaxID=60249 RepID=UPI0038FBE61E